MPKLDTPLHVDMLRRGRQVRSFAHRLKAAIRELSPTANPYGLEWGDPDSLPPLQYMRDHFLLPYISNETTVVEIGPGGGRWTRYMVAAKKIYAVDYHQELLNELRHNARNRRQENIVYIRNNGDDFPGVPGKSIDLVFSFGTFVHLDIDIIDRYLANIRALLRPAANVVIQYSDKTKPVARNNSSFSENDPERMRQLVVDHGYSIYEEDLKTMWHSGIIRFGISADAA